MADIDERARAVAALRFRALGDETRLGILQLLGDGERCVADLMETSGLGQSLVSHHLRTLRDAGLVTKRAEGRWAYYRVSRAGLAWTRNFVYALEPIEMTAI